MPNQSRHHRCLHISPSFLTRVVQSILAAFLSFSCGDSKESISEKVAGEWRITIHATDVRCKGNSPLYDILVPAIEFPSPHTDNYKVLATSGRTISIVPLEPRSSTFVEDLLVNLECGQEDVSVVSCQLSDPESERVVASVKFSDRYVEGEAIETRSIHENSATCEILYGVTGQRRR